MVEANWFPIFLPQITPANTAPACTSLFPLTWFGLLMVWVWNQTIESSFASASNRFSKKHGWTTYEQQIPGCPRASVSRSAPTPSAPISHWQPHAGSLGKIRHCLTFNIHFVGFSAWVWNWLKLFYHNILGSESRYCQVLVGMGSVWTLEKADRVFSLVASPDIPGLGLDRPQPSWDPAWCRGGR